VLDEHDWSLFFFQAEDGIRGRNVTGVQTCALPISANYSGPSGGRRLSVRRCASLKEATTFTTSPLLMNPDDRARFGRVENAARLDRKSTRLNSSHVSISYAVFCLKKKNNTTTERYI